jgi:PTS system nitrogen regulatory IIA component
VSDFSTPSMIGDMLAGGAICPRVTATDKRQVLSVISEVAARVHRLKAGAVFDALLQREAIGSTGVGHGVAIPHALIPGIDRIRGVFVRLTPAIDYAAVDDEPVDLVFALLAPPSDAAAHLRSLARTARALRSADLRRQLRLAHGADALRALLSREARPNAA